jgi:dihydrodipicolinate synthase/N-acetylneuraminate lyase
MGRDERPNDPGTRSVNAMCVTPFAADGSLDEEGLGTIVGFLADAGVGIYLGS